MKTALPKVSVGIACYNHENFIRACLNSIKTQTWQNIELIISDDCSKDNTRQFIKDWDSQNPGIISRILLPEENQGIARNLNSMRPYMTGKYLCFFAGDDQMLPKKIEKQVQALEKQSEAGLCYTDMYWYDPDRDKAWFRHFGFLQKPPKDLAALIEDNVLPSPSFMIRASKFPEIGYDERLPIVNDYKLGIDMMASAPIVFVNEPLVNYCKHQASLTAKSFYVADRFKLHAMLKKAYQGKYDSALRVNKALCLYALGRQLNKDRKRRKTAMFIFWRLLPYYFRSIKWVMRGAMYLKSFL